MDIEFKEVTKDSKPTPEKTSESAVFIQLTACEVFQELKNITKFYQRTKIIYDLLKMIK